MRNLSLALVLFALIGGSYFSTAQSSNVTTTTILFGHKIKGKGQSNGCLGDGICTVTPPGKKNMSGCMITATCMADTLMISFNTLEGQRYNFNVPLPGNKYDIGTDTLQFVDSTFNCYNVVVLDSARYDAFAGTSYLYIPISPVGASKHGKKNVEVHKKKEAMNKNKE